MLKTLARERDVEEILRRLQRIRPDSDRRWGRMTAPQMICHLCDSSRMAIGRRPALPTGGRLHRTALKYLALYAPLRWRGGIETSRELDQECDGTRPADFADDVRNLRALVGEMTAPTADLDGRVHPIFGPLSRAEWLRWGYLHMDHHLRQFGV